MKAPVKVYLYAAIDEEIRTPEGMVFLGELTVEIDVFATPVVEQ